MPPQTADLIPQNFLDGGSGEKQEDIMQFVHNLMQGTEYTSNGASSSAGVSNPQQQSLSGSSFMIHSTGPFVPVENQLQTSPTPYQLPESAVNSPPYLTDNAVNSPTADTPLYSPVTPIQNSPAGKFLPYPPSLSPLVPYNNTDSLILLKQHDKVPPNND